MFRLKKYKQKSHFFQQFKKLEMTDQIFLQIIAHQKNAQLYYNLTDFVSLIMTEISMLEVERLIPCISQCLLLKK